MTSIVEDGPPKSQLEAIESIGEFEQSLRSGYAIAHLARRLGGEACSGPIFNVCPFFPFLFFLLKGERERN